MKLGIIFTALLIVPGLWAQSAESTEKNKRDRHPASVTADKQSNNPEDLAVLKKIRQTLIDDSSLSTNAHNVKVIVAEGAVTLRGPVDSKAEKNRVEEIVKQIAGPSAVKSYLEIAKSKGEH